MAELLVSDPVIEQMMLEQRAGVDFLTMRGIQPAVSAVTTNRGDRTVASYLRSMRDHAESVDVAYTEYNYPGDESRAIDTVCELNEQSGGGTIVMLPLADGSRQEEVICTIAPHRDIDGLNSRNFFAPATPRAVIRLAEHGVDDLANIEPDRIAVIGAGKLVGGPLIDELRDRDIEPVIITHKRNQERMEELGEDFDLVLATAGAAEIIQPHHVFNRSAEDPLTIIDAGAGIAADGSTRGNIDRRLYTMDGLLLSPFTRGVGRLTSAYLLQHTLEAAEMDLSMSVAR